MMNKRGPKHDPCGTTQSKPKRSERDPLIENHSKAAPHIPNSSFRRVSRMLLLTVSIHENIICDFDKSGFRAMILTI